MAKIIQISDFKGKYAISQSANTVAILQLYIDLYEKKYIHDLLGVTLGNLYLADIVTNFTEPTTTIYKNIHNELSQDEPYIKSNGIKEMLLGFIYFEYIKSRSVINTNTGNIIPQNEVSLNAEYNSTNGYSNYNEAIRTYTYIQKYIDLNSSVYPTYKGLYKSLNSWAV